MFANVRPILSALLRGRAGAVLVAVQIAVALAIVVNAVYIVKQRVDKIGRPTGIDVDNLFVISTAGFTDRFKFDAAMQTDLAYLRGLRGVAGASFMGTVPLTGMGDGIYMSASPTQHGIGQVTDFITMDEQGLQTLGVHLIAGRPFRREDVITGSAGVMSMGPNIVATRAWVQTMFPGQSGLGRTVYYPGGSPARIIGVIDHLQGAFTGVDKIEMVAIAPNVSPVPNGTSYYYVVRTAPGERERIMRFAEEHLATSNPDRVIDWVRPLSYFKARAYASDAALAGVLVAVTVLLLGVMALGAFGLASYHVSTRTRQIGTRRAVGARARDILDYFLVENGLVTSVGVVIGSLLALGVGYGLSLELQLPRLDLYYLVGGILVLWGVGELAAWWPARRAAKVSPATATRTV